MLHALQCNYIDKLPDFKCNEIYKISTSTFLLYFKQSETASFVKWLRRTKSTAINIRVNRTETKKRNRTEVPAGNKNWPNRLRHRHRWRITKRTVQHVAVVKILDTLCKKNYNFSALYMCRYVYIQYIYTVQKSNSRTLLLLSIFRYCCAPHTVVILYSSRNGNVREQAQISTTSKEFFSTIKIFNFGTRFIWFQGELVHSETLYGSWDISGTDTNGITTYPHDLCADHAITKGVDLLARHGQETDRASRSDGRENGVQ